MLKKYGRPLVYKLNSPLIYQFVKHKISPNTIVTFGLMVNIAVVFIVGAEIVPRENLSYVGRAGALARVGGMSSVYGALYDSVLDRWS